MNNITAWRSAWKGAFANAVIRIRPDLNPDAVDELSDSAFILCSDLYNPVLAATRWAARQHASLFSGEDVAEMCATWRDKPARNATDQATSATIGTDSSFPKTTRA